MATDLHYAQEAKRMCGIHTADEIDMFCLTCYKQMCSKCVKDSHRSHEWEILHKVVREKRQEIPDKCRKLRDEKIPQIRTYIKDLRAAKVSSSEIKIETVQKINVQKNKIIMQAEILAEKMIAKIESGNKAVTERLDTMLSSVEKNVEEIETLLETLDLVKTSGTDNGIMDLDEALEVRMNLITKPEICKLTQCPIFHEGFIQNTILEQMFGFVGGEDEEGLETTAVLTTCIEQPTVTVSKHASFTYTDKNIRAIYAVSETEAWAHKQSSAENEKVTIKGKQVQQISASNDIAHFTIINDTDTVYTDFEGCTVDRITATGQRTTLINTAPLHPWGVSISLSGDLLLILMDNDTYNTNIESQRLVRQVTLAGEVMKTYQYDHSNQRLFTLPSRVRQNYNSDICVVDLIETGRGQVYILTEDGTVKNMYTGYDAQNKFGPTDIAFDINCNILVCDWQYHRIHLLHHTGQFLKYLITDADGLLYPYCLSLRKDNLWFGCNKGIVQLFKYKF